MSGAGRDDLSPVCKRLAFCVCFFHCLYVCWLVRLFVCSLACLFVCSFVCWLICLFVGLLVDSWCPRQHCVSINLQYYAVGQLPIYPNTTHSTLATSKQLMHHVIVEFVSSDASNLAIKYHKEHSNINKHNDNNVKKKHLTVQQARSNTPSKNHPLRLVLASTEKKPENSLRTA